MPDPLVLAGAADTHATLTIAVALLGLSVAAVGFFVKRWMDRSDDEAKTQRAELEQTRRDVAILMDRGDRDGTDPGIRRRRKRDDEEPG